MTDSGSPPAPATPSRAGMVAVVGRANTGKSTLVNRILGEKISIVSPVAQTTRNLIRGILTETRGQIAFLDTPGIHKAETDLGKIMNRIGRASIEGVDVALLVLDASRPPRLEDDGWMRRLLKQPDLRLFAALNKCDQKEDFSEAYRELWSRIAEERGQTRQLDWHRISALNGDGVESLLTSLFEEMPEGPYLFPEDVLTDFPRKLAIADVVREKYFHVLTQELPHHLAVWIEEIDDASEPWKINGTLYVQRPGQKGIVIGKKGNLLKKVTREAEAELAEMYGVRMNLELWVKVDKDWSRNFWILRKLGYA